MPLQLMVRFGQTRISRRALVAGCAVACFVALARSAWPGVGGKVLFDPKRLKAGQFEWHPERSPDGPVVVIVSIPEQWAAAYRNGILIGVSTCSTGKPGHETPTGTFIILQKEETHRSSLYDDAPMPFMERLTWSGVALHAGKLPGYPASHGCIRLPPQFAKLLYGVTHLGTAVIVADQASAPSDVMHPGLLIPGHAEAMAKAAVKKAAGKKAHPPDATTETHDAVAFVASAADGRFRALVDGKIVLDDAMTVRDPRKPLGTHVFTLTGPADDAKNLKWMAVGLGAPPAKAAASSAKLAETTIRRLQLSDATARHVTELLHPGATMVVTDASAEQSTRTDPGFSIMTHDDT
jgi:hypothetical protein